MSIKKLSIVIPVFNNCKFTAMCLDSIFGCGYSKNNYEIIIVDNGSTDQTSKLVSHLIEQNESIKYIQLKENLDFLKSTNIGWKEASTPFIMLLNNDIILHENTIETMMKSIEHNDKLGVVGAIEYLPTGELSKEKPFGFKLGENPAESTYVGFEDDLVKKNEDGNIVYVDYIGSACCILKKEVSDKIGFFDEYFAPCMFEQEDYWMRIKEAGYKIGISKASEFTHFVGSTTAFNRIYYSKIIETNREKFLKKWWHKINLTILIPVYNHWKTTATCLSSIFKSETDLKYDAIVIDDASTDSTSTFLKYLKEKENRPVTIIRNEKNLGFVESLNVGITNSIGNFVLFLNNDVSLDKNCISELHSKLVQYEDVGILGALPCNPNWESPAPLQYLLRGENATIRDHVISQSIPKDLIDSNIIYTDIAPIACFMMKKSLIDKLGLLDMRFSPANYEQEDYCLRAKEAGYQVAVCPKAKFIHYGAVSVSDNIVYYSQILNRNRELFLKKWGNKLLNNKI